MASRLPRRQFATPFVAVVGVSACNIQSQPPQPVASDLSATQQPEARPPEPIGTGTTNVGDRGRPPEAVDPPPPQAGTETRWTVYAAKPGDCYASFKIACPKGPPGGPMPTCNPPPPVKYACPEGVKLPVEIMRESGKTACFTVPAPPQAVACPER